MSKIRKRKNRPSLRRRNSGFANAVRLYNLIPRHSPPVQPCVPITSLDFLESVVARLWYNGNKFSLFLKVCGVVGLNSPRLEKKVFSVLNCYTADYQRIARFIQSDEEKKRRMRLIAPPLCPGCGRSLAVRDLSSLPSSRNRLGWQSHWICIDCLFEFYSSVSVDRFGFPAEPVTMWE